MARNMRPSRRPGDLSPDAPMSGLKSEDLQKDMTEDEKSTTAAMPNSWAGATASLSGRKPVTVGDVTAAVARKQKKIAGLRKSR